MTIAASDRMKAWVKSLLMPTSAQVNPPSFDPGNVPAEPSEAVINTVRRMRGNFPPAIMLHGAMHRTGTNYVWALLMLHPDLSGPEGNKEFHFLPQFQNILRMQREFETSSSIERAPGTASPPDFVALFSTAMLHHLYTTLPHGRRLFLKVPSVAFLNYFPVAFAHEHLLLLNRDGRDVVESHRQSFPHVSFDQATRFWDRAVKLMLTFQRRMAGSFTFDLVRYEDAVRSPEETVRQLCERFSLDASRYPFEQIEHIPLRGSSTIRNKGADKWRWQMAQKPKDFDPVGRWRTWGEIEKRTFKTIAGQSLIDCGYAEDTNW